MAVNLRKVIKIVCGQLIGTNSVEIRRGLDDRLT